MSGFKFYIVFCPIFLAVAGCEKRADQQAAGPFQEDDSSYVLMVVLDLSGSFRELMFDDGAAYQFTTYALDRYFKDRIGTDDQLILAQLSGEKNTLVWQGTPRQLREQFPTPEKFRRFLQSYAVPGGSVVHDGVSHAVRYLMSHPAVRRGKARSALLVLSDMQDTTGDDGSEDRVLNVLTQYINSGGVAGFYYVGQDEYFTWVDHFTNAGFDTCVVEMDIQGRPKLPVFE